MIFKIHDPSATVLGDAHNKETRESNWVARELRESHPHKEFSWLRSTGMRPWRSALETRTGLEKRLKGANIPGDNNTHPYQTGF
jgi:hypothetical protein